jgi:adenosylhomocysteine nucleosidase
MAAYDFENDPSILIEGAMDTETDHLIGLLKNKRTVCVGNRTYHTGFLGAHDEPVVISRTYQGIVNAAAATELAIAHFNPRIVINQGIGGAHDTALHVGDIVIGEKVVPMGAIKTGFSPSGAGIDASDFTINPVEIYDKASGGTGKVSEFPCDERLVALAETVRTACTKMRGVICSSDEWNNQLDRIALLRERYHTAVEDMESVAPALLCLSYGIPFIGIRIISNSIVNDEGFDESVGIAGQEFVAQFVEALHEAV